MENPGRKGELLVARYLEAQGLAIWGRNVRLGPLEVDLVAIDGRCVALVEVRMRKVGALVSPLASLGPQKRRHLRHAGERLWSRHFRRDSRVDHLRFDIAAVYTAGEHCSIEYCRGVLLA